ncbi:MAG: hypothetical protein HS116_17455 [Planctomycetes bacterium]|nr:hypothetical protein [Planctomycetota bacterium]
MKLGTLFVILTVVFVCVLALGGTWSWGAAAGVLVGACYVLAGALWFVNERYSVGSATWLERHNAAVGLLNAGRIEEALAELQRLEPESQKHPLGHATCLANLSAGYLRKGDPDRAMELAFAGHELLPGKPKNEQQKQVAALLRTRLAHLHALLNVPESAHAWRERAAEAVTPNNRHMLFETDIVLKLRAGQDAAALEQLAQDWTGAETQLYVAQLKPLRVLWAFALSRQAPGAERDARIADLLAGARPMRAGELAYMGARWPEFEAFLREQGLG